MKMSYIKSTSLRTFALLSIKNLLNCTRCLSIVFILLITGSSVRAEILLQDPCIPDGERITYNFYVGDDSGTLVEKVHIKKEHNRQIYEVTSRSIFVDKDVKFVKETMIVLYTRTANKTGNTIIERTTALVKDESEAEEDEVKTLDYNGLHYVLRGLPFEEVQSAKIRIIGGSGMFSMKVKVVNKENITVENKTINCYKLELGLSGALSLLFPKSKLWYNVAPPHYLVRSESPRAMGLPSQVLELVEYSLR